MLHTPKASFLERSRRRCIKLPTEAGVNTNQSRQTAQGQFAAASAFAEKNANKIHELCYPGAENDPRLANYPLTDSLHRIGDTVRQGGNLLFILTFHHHADQGFST